MKSTRQNFIQPSSGGEQREQSEQESFNDDDNLSPIIIKNGVLDPQKSLKSFENSEHTITPSGQVSFITEQKTISLLPFNAKQYQDAKLQEIIENEDDEKNINIYKFDSVIQKSLVSMRHEDRIREYKLMRVIGINPECILNQHVKDSVQPGERYDMAEELHEQQHNEHEINDEFNMTESSDSSEHFEISKWLIILPGSNVDSLWSFISILSCLVSPYFYAWLALHGHEKEDKQLLAACIIFESIFAVDIFVNFITAYVPDGEINPVKDHQMIFVRYFYGDFLSHMIPTIPLTFVLDMGNDKQYKILYFVKVIRLLRGLEFYNVQFVMDFLKEKNSNIVMKNIENDPSLLLNLDLDQNNINFFFNIRYGLKVFKLFLEIMNVSYFTGIVWMTFCQINYRQLQKSEDHEDSSENFFEVFDLVGHHQSDGRQVLISLYFSFTSLSTVGFGDYHPRSDIERIFCSVILVGGVMVFSYIMGNFIAMLENYRVLNGEIDEGDQLAKFFGLMKRFNKNKDINENLKTRIEQYFVFRWQEDKLQAIDDEGEQGLLDQLPGQVQDQLMSNFIFNDFVHNFRGFFQIEKKIKQKLSDIVLPGSHCSHHHQTVARRVVREFYTWNDNEYRDFMIKTLSSLEPVFYNQGTKIYKELDEFYEINFISKGETQVGFKINEIEHYALRQKEHAVIGAYGVTFTNRSQFIYKAATYCQGVFIRKAKWHDILKEQDHAVCDIIKQNIVIQYMWHFRTKIIARKKKVIEQFKGRNDYQNMSAVDNADQQSINTLMNKLFNHSHDDDDEKLDNQTLVNCIRNVKVCNKVTSKCFQTFDKMLDIIQEKNDRIRQLEEEVQQNQQKSSERSIIELDNMQLLDSQRQPQPQQSWLLCSPR